MPRIEFTPNLHRHVVVPTAEVVGNTVATALDDYFARHPGVRGYVLDDQGAVRKHMLIFLNGELIADRHHLSDPVGPDDQIFVAQALSGG